jgi:hypothetical protein
MIATGCSSSSAGVRKFYLISLKYNSSSKSSFIKDISDALSSDTGKNGTFNDLRVGYSGICVETQASKNADAEWHCGKKTSDFVPDLGGDPLSLASVGDMYREEVAYVLPLWISLGASVIAFLLLAANNIPFVNVPPITRKIAAAMTAVAMLFLLGSMCLQKVTTEAVQKLVNSLSAGAVEIHLGRADIAFGWAAFGTSLLAAICAGVVTLCEMVVERTQRKAEEVAARSLDKLSGGRVDLEDARNGYSAFARGDSEARKKMGKNGISVAGSLVSKGIAALKK